MLTTINNLLPLALTPIERINAAERGIAGTQVGLWWWALPALLVGILLVMLTASIYLRWQAREKAALETFRSQADTIGLTQDECNLLHFIARQAMLRNASAIFSMDGAFDTGVAALMRSQRIAQATPAQRTNICAMLSNLRDKLGFQRSSDDDAPQPMSSRQINAGAYVSVIEGASADGAKAQVTQCDPVEMVIEATREVQGQPGESLLLRYFDGATLWEFDAAIIRRHGNVFTLGHAEQLRFINRRRFPRVPTNLAAQVAVFPFENGTTLAPPTFMECQLVEIAGTGLKLRAVLSPKMGERVIVVVKLFEGRVVQGLAKVRRINAIVGAAQPHPAGMQDIAVEMLGLHPTEVAELAKETNLAVKRAETELPPEELAKLKKEAEENEPAAA